MKRASIFVVVLLLSGALFAQVHGVPASVTSYGPGRGQAPGVPASVTSLGPNGYSGNGGYYPFFPIGSTPATMAGQAGHHHGGGTGHGGHHSGANGNGGYGYGGGYVYVPYAVPVTVEPDEPAQENDEPEPPAPTIFEHRPMVQPAPNSSERYGEHYLGSRERPTEALVDQDAVAKHVNLSPVSEEKIPVVIVFKDGHKQEIGNGNYAIVGELLYDLSGPIAKKYKLTDLDLTQTVQLNEQRGVEFSLPASYKPQA